MKQQKKKPVVVAVSGGFDPLHIGHVRMMKDAKKFGDRLVVILNNDNWLLNKKGYVFMPQKERREVILALASVDDVALTRHAKNAVDTSVASALEKLRPDIFANGGDRESENTPEEAVCKKLGIRMVFGVGRGGKIQSSSWLMGRYVQESRKEMPADRADENISHFRCGTCKKSWSVGEAADTQIIWACPWCGTRQPHRRT
jgi:cytidyltransferase-like protein